MKRVLVGAIAVLALAPTASASARTADPTFGTDGVAAVNIAGHDHGTQVLFSPGGKVVVVGTVDDGRIGIARFTKDGVADATFSKDGVTSISPATLSGPGEDIYPSGAATLSDGSIIVGTTTAVVKLQSNGRLDTRFGTKGVARPAVPASAIALAVAPNGSIVVAAATGAGLGYYGGAFTAMLIRFTKAGKQDLGFGTGGVVSLPPDTVIPSDVVVQRDGRIVVGSTLFAPFTSDYLIQRFTSAGVPDETFGAGGSARVDPGKSPLGYDVLRGVALQRDGKIIAFGDAMDLQRGWSPAMARLKPDGSPDRFVNSRGVGIFPLNDQPGMFMDAVIRYDGVIFAATDAASRRYFKPVLVRIAEDGSDMSAVTDMGPPQAYDSKGPFGYVPSLAVAGRRIVATGPSHRDSERANQLIVAAYRP